MKCVCVFFDMFMCVYMTVCVRDMCGSARYRCDERLPHAADEHPHAAVGRGAAAGVLRAQSHAARYSDILMWGLTVQTLQSQSNRQTQHVVLC